MPGAFTFSNPSITFIGCDFLFSTKWRWYFMILSPCSKISSSFFTGMKALVLDALTDLQNPRWFLRHLDSCFKPSEFSNRPKKFFFRLFWNIKREHCEKGLIMLTRNYRYLTLYPKQGQFEIIKVHPKVFSKPHLNLPLCYILCTLNSKFGYSEFFVGFVCSDKAWCTCIAFLHFYLSSELKPSWTKGDIGSESSSLLTTSLTSSVDFAVSSLFPMFPFSVWFCAK